MQRPEYDLYSLATDLVANKTLSDAIDLIADKKRCEDIASVFSAVSECENNASSTKCESLDYLLYYLEVSII